MTILAVKNQLVTYFLSNDTFEFGKNQLDIEFDKPSIDFREDLTRLALAELEISGIVKKITHPAEREIWVLVQPIHSFIQNVQVGPLVSSIIADTINHYNELQGIDMECNKTHIEEQDILRLIGIIQMLGDFAEEESDEEGEKQSGSESSESSKND